MFARTVRSACEGAGIGAADSSHVRAAGSTGQIYLYDGSSWSLETELGGNTGGPSPSTPPTSGRRETPTPLTPGSASTMVPPGASPPLPPATLTTSMPPTPIISGPVVRTPCQCHLSASLPAFACATRQSAGRFLPVFQEAQCQSLFLCPCYTPGGGISTPLGLPLLPAGEAPSGDAKMGGIPPAAGLNICPSTPSMPGGAN